MSLAAQIGSESTGPTIGNWALASEVSEWIEYVAIAVISLSVIIAAVSAARAYFGGAGRDAHQTFKDTIAKGLLLGLDLLIAADIIRTVTLEPTLTNVAALGLLVVVRTFLSWSLVLETENRWPWQRDPIERSTSR